MKDKRFFIFILVVLLAFGLAACTRKASQPSSSEDDANLPLPTMGTQEPMSMLEEMATQTAMAQDAGNQEAAPDAGGDQGAAPEVAPAEGSTEETAPDEGTTSTGGDEGSTADSGTSGDTPEEGGGQEPVAAPKEYDVPSSYTLKAGEFPYCIARRFNISPAELLNANSLGITSQVYPGTKLTIPKNASPFDQGSRALRSHPTNYTVVAGDSVYSIACLYGDVDPRAIAEVNGLGDSYAITAGKVLKIP